MSIRRTSFAQKPFFASMPVSDRITLISIVFMALSALTCAGSANAQSINSPGLAIAPFVTLDSSAIPTNTFDAIKSAQADPASSTDLDDPTNANIDVLASTDVDDADAGASDTGETADNHFDPRAVLTTIAMKLRNIRYRHGGSTPITGFDCSGFVRYVFQTGLGLQLPTTSAAQFRSGERVSRHDLQTGDLVFFRIRGKRISHVGIYIDHGRFIHSPSTGKVVRVDRLDDAYWARRFAGAKRVEALPSGNNLARS